MTPITGDTAAAPRWRTILFDGLGFAAVIWSIPLVIVLIGVPIALLVKLAQIVGRAVLNAF